MAEFRAVVPHAEYDETATIADAAWAEVVTSARARFGKVPTGEVDENQQPVMREMTEKECIKRILGTMLQGWLQNAAADKAERDRAAIKIEPADWVVT